MEFRSIRQTSHISGNNRNPGAFEHNKALVWDNNVAKFKYVLYSNLGANTKINNGFVYKGDDSPGASYVWKLDANKNPFWRKEDFLVSVSRTSGGNSATFVMNDSANKVLPLGALAWLDTVPGGFTLPGNTKVLFDDSNTIGGDSAFTYDKTNKLLNLTAFAGIQVKNNTDAALKGVLQYFGNKNLVLGHGTTRSVAWGANLVNNILLGDNAGGSFTTAQNNVILGHLAGSNTVNNIQGSVFIGNYAGRLETANNRFYLANANYGTLSEAKLESLLWGDFSTGWLKVNNRLEIGEEARIGTFDITNTPSWGMLQFIGTGTPDEYKPQYYDGFMWQDFASGANYYLNNVTKATADVGTTSDSFKLTFDMAGLPDFTLQLGANAFNSDIIPQASVNATVGLLQISSGNNSDSNRGFTSFTGLLWDTPNTELNIPGAIKLSAKARYTTAGNVIIGDGVHYYGRIGSNWVQLDNEPTSGQANELRFDGSVPISGDLSLPKDGIYLPIKGIKPKSTEPRLIIENNITDKDLDLSLNLTVTGTNYSVVTGTLTSANVFKETNTPNGIAPTLKYRPLISSDDSVQFSITANDEINISVPAGAGNPNLYTLQDSLGAGVSIIDHINSTAVDFKLKTINQGLHNTVAVNANGIQLDVDVDDLTLNNSGDTNYVLSIGADTFDLTQKQFIAGDAISIVDSAGLTFAVNKEIPKFGFTPSPTYIPGYPGQPGWMLFKADYSPDIRTSDVLESTVMFTLGIGAGLVYDAGTNTLEATSSAASTTDYRLTSISYVGNIATLHMTDEVGGGVEQTVDLTLPTMEDAPIATYTDNIDPHYGGVIVNRTSQVKPLGTEDAFVLNETTGEMSFGLNPVTFAQQYELHDDVNDVTARGFARANIQSAYINGEPTEDFWADKLDAVQINVDTVSANEFASDVSKIQGVKFKGPHITSDESNIGVYLSKRNLSTDAPSAIEVKAGSVAITTNGLNGSGNIDFYTTKSGSQVRIAYLDDSGNLHIKGEFITFDTTV